MRIFFLLTVFLFGMAPSIGAVPLPVHEAGVPLLEVFSPRDYGYGAHDQNWAMVQDLQGRVLVGNGSGVLIFDGSTWQLVPVSNGSIVRSLALGPKGEVFVGAVGELGLLEPTEDGDFRYTSLMAEIPKEVAGFTNVWRTFARPEGAVFWAGEIILRWDGQRFLHWMLAPSRVPFELDGQLYFNDKNLGLLVLQDDDLSPIAGSEALSELAIFVALAFDQERFLIGTRDQGLFLATHPTKIDSDHPITFEPFETEASEILDQHRIYSGKRLHHGSFALGTMTGGLVVIDSNGDILYRVDRSTGLPDSSIWAVFTDREEGLWLGLNRGLARLETGSPIRQLSPQTGLEGTVEDLLRFQGQLHVATSLGLMRLEPSGFRLIEGPRPPCWSLLSTPPSPERPKQLLVGCNNGVWKIDGDSATPVLEVTNAFVLYSPPSTPDTVLVGHDGGLHRLSFESRKWKNKGHIPGLDHEVRSLVEANSTLWIGTHFNGVFASPDWNRSDIEGPSIHGYGRSDGLPSEVSVKVTLFSGRLLLGTSGGLYEFDELDQRFTRSALLGPKDVGRSILRLVPGDQEDLWISHLDITDSPSWHALNQDHSPNLQDLALKRLPRGSYYGILPETSGTTWFGGPEGLFRFDRQAPPLRENRMEVFFSSLTARGPDLSEERLSLSGATTLPFARNWIRADFAATGFDGRKRILFRTKLEGLETQWSGWSREHQREFTTLHEGDYRLAIQAQDAYGRESLIEAVEFSIDPPWHRTTLAYLGFAVASILVIFLAVRLRSRQLERERNDLESAIRLRTIELQRRTTDLEAIRRELETFSYAVSHDLRAPLRRIDGFAQVLLEDYGETLDDQGLHMLERMRANSQDLAELIDAMLQLSRVSRVEIVPMELDLTAISEGLLDDLRATDPERNVEVVIRPDLRAIGDSRLVTLILQNLIENAWKFTSNRPEARIEVGIAHHDSGLDSFFVRDNGAGFEMRHVDKLFEPFQRLHSQVEFPGTGIGLATVKRLVDRHGGKVWAESEVDQGTTVYFNLEPATE